MADADPIQPIHEPALPILDEERMWVHDAADRFEGATAQELLAWAIETFHPRLAISAAGGVDGMAIIDMAWRIDPSIRVFTLDTGRLPPETYTLFEEVRERYGIDVEFETPDGAARADFELLGRRFLYRQAIETARCLAEGVLTSTHEANIGSIFGIGFPAWTGGAMQFIASEGRERFIARADELAARCGERFALSPEVRAVIPTLSS